MTVLVAAPAKAATTFNWGVKAALSFSDVAWSDDNGSEKLLVQPTFGVFALVNLTPCLAIQPEVDYLVTGESWKEDIKVVDKSTYLHIPVLVRYQFVKQGKALPSVVAGPAIGFLLSAKAAGEDVKDFLKSTFRTGSGYPPAG